MIKQLLNEINYIVGIDLSAHEAIVSYLDHKSFTPIIFDMSGGYGQSAIPLAMLYLVEEKEWLIGEQAFLNRHQENTIFVSKLLELNLQSNILTIGNHQYSSEELLLIFIKKILEGLVQINPKANIVDLAIAIPDDLHDEIEGLVELSLKPLSEHLKLQIVPSTKALIKYLQYYEVAFDSKTVVLYYEYEHFRTSTINKNGNEIHVTIDKNDENLSIKLIEKIIKKKFASIYLEHIKKEVMSIDDENSITELIHNQLPWFFQKYRLKQGMKIYYSFAYPPFQKLISFKEIEELLLPFEKRLREFVKTFKVDEYQVILIGTGYKMHWPIAIINEFTKPMNINPVGCISKGCCLIAAQEIIGLAKWSIKYKPTRRRHLGTLIIDKNEEHFMPIKEGSNLMIIDLEGYKESFLPIYYRDPVTKTLMIEQEVLIEKKSDEGVLRINLQMVYIEESIHIAVEYLPL